MFTLLFIVCTLIDPSKAVAPESRNNAFKSNDLSHQRNEIDPENSKISNINIAKVDIFTSKPKNNSRNTVKNTIMKISKNNNVKMNENLNPIYVNIKGNGQLNKIILELEVSELTLTSPSDTSSLSAGASLSFSFTVTGVSDATTGKISAALYTSTEEHNDFTGLTPVDNLAVSSVDSGSNKYSFNFEIPSGTSAGSYNLIAQYSVDSTTSGYMKYTTQALVVFSYSVECNSLSSHIFAASDIISLSCIIPSDLSSKVIKYKLDDGQFSSQTVTVSSGLIKVSYPPQTSLVSKLTIGWFDSSSSSIPITENSFDVQIVPVPSVTTIADSTTGSSYIVGDTITVTITTGYFYQIEKATISYGFVSTSEDTVTMTTATSTPVAVSGQSNQFTLSITVPESENTAGEKYLKMRFIDLAQQSTTVTSSDKITFRQTIKVDQLTVSGGSDHKFKGGEDIVVRFTMSNLDTDWKSNTKFGYSFDDGTVSFVSSDRISYPTSVRKIHADTTTSQIVELKISAPETPPETGSSSLKVYVYNNDNAIVSIPVTTTITYSSETATPTKDDDDGEIANWIIPVVILVVILVAIIVVVVLVLIFNKRNQGDNSEDVCNQV